MRFNCATCGSPDADADWDSDVNDPEAYICFDCSIEAITGKSWEDRIIQKAERRVAARQLLEGLDDE